MSHGSECSTNNSARDPIREMGCFALCALRVRAVYSYFKCSLSLSSLNSCPRYGEHVRVTSKKTEFVTENDQPNPDRLLSIINRSSGLPITRGVLAQHHTAGSAVLVL